MECLRDPQQDADAVDELRRYRISEPEGDTGEVGYQVLSDSQMELPRTNYERTNSSRAGSAATPTDSGRSKDRDGPTGS